MLSARTGDKLRAISEVARKGRRVKDLRRLMNHPDLWMQAYLNIQGNKGALTRGTDQTTMDGYSLRIDTLNRKPLENQGEKV